MSILKATFENFQTRSKFYTRIFSARISEISWSRGFQKVYSQFRPKKKLDPRRLVICSGKVPWLNNKKYSTQEKSGPRRFV
jgi:hypothetical protein